MNLSKKLKELREAKAWSLVDTAKRAQVPISSYRGWEEGRKVPVEMLVKLAEIHGISISHLLGERQVSNQELAQAMSCFERGMEHLKKAISRL